MRLHFGRREPCPKPLGGVARWLRLVQHQANQGDQAELVVDIASVKAVNSQELGEIVRLHLRLRDAGRRLVLQNPQEQVRELFELTRVDRLVHVRELDPSGVG